MRTKHILAATALLAAALFAAGGPTDARAAAPGPHPAYCGKLLSIAQNWRTACLKGSPWACQGRGPVDRRQEVVGRLAGAAAEAAAAGRDDVAEAVRLSLQWVHARGSATEAFRARATRLGERMTMAGRRASPTIATDCGFTFYPRPAGR